MPNIAKDAQTGFLVLAKDGIKKRKYMCMCPDEHAVCFKRGSERVPHFAHIPVRGQDGGPVIPSCRIGGESEEHIMAKHMLVERVGHYGFALKTCEICREKVIEYCKYGTLEIESRSGDNQWRYDVLYTRFDGTKLALEVHHTHATDAKKIRSSVASGIPIAELDAGEILKMHQGVTLLDNKLDASWICSDKCRVLKQQRDADLERTVRTKERKRQRQMAEAERYVQLLNQRKIAKEREAIRAAEKARIVNGHPPLPRNTKFDYTPPIMGQPSDHKKSS